jgi:hypothetical protein
MALRVPRPDMTKVFQTLVPGYGSMPQPTAMTDLVQPSTAVVGLDGLCDFDDLSIPQVRLPFVT